MIFSAYRKDDFADADSFVTQLGMVLDAYPDTIVEWVSHPLSGIQRRSKFPPTIAEVVEACDDEANRRDRVKQYAAMPKPAPRIEGPRQNRANLFVPESSPVYLKMLERTKTADLLDWRYDLDRPGIWVVQDWYERGRTMVDRSKIEAILAGAQANKPQPASQSGAAE